MLEANISSTRRIAEFWGLTAAAHAEKAQQPDAQPASSSWAGGIAGVRKTITDALRAAGLMK